MSSGMRDSYGGRMFSDGKGSVPSLGEPSREELADALEKVAQDFVDSGTKHGFLSNAVIEQVRALLSRMGRKVGT